MQAEHREMIERAAAYSLSAPAPAALCAACGAALAEIDALTARVAEMEAELLDRPIYAPSVNDGISLYWGNVDGTVFTVRGNAAYCYRRHGGANHDHIDKPTPEQIEAGIEWVKNAPLQPASDTFILAAQDKMCFGGGSPKKTINKESTDE